jgi:hypothetical protein
MNGNSVDQTARHRSFDHRRRQRRAVATADARTPQQPQIGDEEIHRTCILLEGAQGDGARMCGRPKYLLDNNITNTIHVIHNIHRASQTTTTKQQQILSFQK